MRPGATRGPTLREYLTVSQGAVLLGVSAATLRNWVRAGKVAVRRHSVNGSRVAERGDDGGEALARVANETCRGVAATEIRNIWPRNFSGR